MKLPPGIEKCGVQLYDYPRREDYTPQTQTDQSQPDQQQAPLQLIFATSLRDIAADDRVGSLTDIPRGLSYMMGLIEATNLAINECYHDLGNYINIRGIITDDLPTDYTDPIRTYQNPYAPWIYPLHDRNDEGKPLGQLTTHIPSDFRMETDKDKRRTKRERFEDEVFAVSQEMGADIIVSDHLMVIINHLLKENRYGIGRTLNLHPGVIDPLQPSRLPGSTPTTDAIERVRDRTVYNNKTRLYEPAPHNLLTGASLHMMTKEVDGGPLIASSRRTLVNKNDRKRDLRYRNYPVKFRVFVEGIIHYVEKLFPHLDSLDLKAKRRLVTTKPFLVDQFREKRQEALHPILDKRHPKR